MHDVNYDAMVEYKYYFPAARVYSNYQLSSPCHSSRYGIPFPASITVHVIPSPSPKLIRRRAGLVL
jgi:hypothetical protein